MRVLFVEDSQRLRRSVGDGLRDAGIEVDLAADGEQGYRQASEGQYDLVILDVMLPRMDGMDVLRRLRAAGRSTSVLMLTARDTVADRVAGLRGGADDYLIKPFAFDELLARIEALSRRSHSRKATPLRVGALEIDPLAKRVRISGEAVVLTPREYALLEFLAQRTNQVVSRSEIESNIYDREADLMSNVVDSAICSLRRKLDRPGTLPVIQTRRGHGYVLSTEIE